VVTAIRITLSQHRLAVFSGMLALLALAAACMAVAWHMQSVAVPASCGTDWLFAGPPIPMPGQEWTDCQRAEQAFFDRDLGEASNLLIPLLLLPMVVGLTTGAGLIATEIEEGTAQLSWWIATSRGRWYAGRVLPPAVILCATLIVTALAAHQLAAARMPGQEPSQSFQFYAMRGWTFVGRGLVAYALAVAVGAAIGRALPALIVSSVLAVALLVGGAAFVRQVWLPSQATLVQDPVVAASPGNLVLGRYALWPDGRMEPTSISAVSSVGADPHEPVVLPDGSVLVTKLVPGAQYRTIDALEGGMWLAAATASLGVAYVVVSRRRPL
jgi:hypothetical protein